jgi:hypothetical protein
VTVDPNRLEAALIEAEGFGEVGDRDDAGTGS